MKKSISLFLSLILVLSVAALPVSAANTRTEVTTYELYLNAIVQYEEAYNDIAFMGYGSTPIWTVETGYFRYTITEAAYKDFSRVNSYARFVMAMKACGSPKTAQELREYNWYLNKSEASGVRSANGYWFNITDEDFKA